MSWHLTRVEARHLQQGFTDYTDVRTGQQVRPANALALDRLKEWWTR
jgi:hypothetical protein